MPRLKNVEVAFAEFVALLINETFDAIISSTAQQVDKIGEMVQAAELPVEDFIRIYVTDQVINNEGFRLFGPSSVNPEFSAVHQGEQYIPAKKDIPEQPAIFSKCGVKMSKGDFVKAEVGMQITDKGKERIWKAIALQLGKNMQVRLRSMGETGVPKLLVESGTISAKLTVRLEEQQMGTSGLNKRMVVRPLSMRNPEVLGMKIDLTSQIEIKFRTIN